MNISLSENDKNYIIKKSKKYGFNSVSAFLVDCAKTNFRLNIDMSVYQKLTQAVDVVGRNINSVVRRINSENIYTDSEINQLQLSLDEINQQINQEYKKLMNLKFHFQPEKLNVNDYKDLIQLLQENDIPTPKKLILEKVFDSIKDDLIYLIDMISKSPEQEQSLSDYLWDLIYSDKIFSLSDTQLVSFADSLFLYTEKIKFKSQKSDYFFEDLDWYLLQDILDQFI